MKKIGIHEPTLKGNEIKYLTSCIRDGWVSTSGKYLNLFTKKLKNITNSNYILPVLNGTIGLHLSLILSGVKRNDEVIVPTITFVASVNAIKYTHANPIFMDVDKFLNIDEEKTIKFIRENTKSQGKNTINKKTGRKIKAIIIVHTFGNAAKFEKLYDICKKKNIKIIEDAAESLGTIFTKNKFKKKHTGTVGDYGVISFNGNKIVTSGNGGALLIKEKKNFKLANYLINQAKNDGLNFIHNNVGYNYRLSNVSAALGLAQLEKLNYFIRKKRLIREYYKKKFKNIKGIEIFESPFYSKNNNWLNLLRVDENIFGKKTKYLIKELNKNNFQVRPVWYPNHMQKMYKKYYAHEIKNGPKMIKNLICLPSSAFLTKKNINKIVKSIKNS
jgi:perosamine synthetase